MKKRALLLISVLLSVLWAQVSFAQNTSRFFSGNYKYTSVGWALNANTLNGADTNSMSINGGGGGAGTSSARGGYVRVFGADYGGAGAGGDVDLGTADNGDVNIRTYNSGGNFYVNLDNLRRWSFETGGAADHSYIYYGDGATANWIAEILSNTVNGADTSMIRIGGGGGAGVTRGGWIDIQGADFGGAALGGDVRINTADNGDIALYTDQSGGHIFFALGGEQKWYMVPTAASTSRMVFGINGSANWIGEILADTSDAADDSILRLSGGGAAIGPTRGGVVEIEGADYGGAGAGGDVRLKTADAGDITLITASSGGHVFIDLDNEQKWYFVPTGASISDLHYGIAGSANWTGRIVADTGNGADDATLELSGGGAAAAVRGGHIRLKGNEVAGTGGAVDIVTGDNGLLTLNASGGTSHVVISDSAGGNWTSFGTVATVTACTTVNGDYVTITLNGTPRRIMLCD